MERGGDFGEGGVVVGEEEGEVGRGGVGGGGVMYWSSCESILK